MFVHALDIPGESVRRRVLELLADGERTSGPIADVIRAEPGLSRPGVSQHLRVLRDSGFASVRTEGVRRFSVVEPAPLTEVDAWLDRFRRFWEHTSTPWKPSRPGRACDSESGWWGAYATGPPGCRCGQDRSISEGNMT
ncbi:helix-turn-helix domain-containing protein [Nonomuraea fuscirosea]|uniref:ArsR/SmtB family transcription factor n=1 Tax=Nonomuraea fuscirosea TaxID=1291556 RepID=UPI002DD8D1B8|nr:metalloregulator ArsR/SmtB family transcription factor [Nonomuraea fuscirosea]WSA50032.1 helix-turn-helix domain-containing protein [Nonomuraea fuscirosea]